MTESPENNGARSKNAIKKRFLTVMNKHINEILSITVRNRFSYPKRVTRRKRPPAEKAHR